MEALDSSPDALNKKSLANSGGSIKAKLLGLDKLIREMGEDLAANKNEVLSLQAEKNALEQALREKLEAARQTVDSEMHRVEDDMKRQFSEQKAEHSKLQQQISQLKVEKTNLQQQLLGLQRKISELETQIGEETS